MRLRAKVVFARFFDPTRGKDTLVPPDLDIAVIDDDESFRVALVESLLSLGYGADGYASAEDYIVGIDRKTFNCIVTDIHMPGMNGLELIRKLASRGATTPVVLITARSDSQLAGKDAAAGAAHLLRKPFESGDLIEGIEGAVRN